MGTLVPLDDRSHMQGWEEAARRIVGGFPGDDGAIDAATNLILFGVFYGWLLPAPDREM